MLLKMDHYIFPFDRHRIHRHSGMVIVRSGSGLNIEHPSMPGTNDFVSLDEPLAERPAAMQADIVHRGDLPIHVSHTNYAVTNRNFRSFSLSRKLRRGAKTDERHRYISIEASV
jgi:hypothetical protein